MQRSGRTSALRESASGGTPAQERSDVIPRASRGTETSRAPTPSSSDDGDDGDRPKISVHAPEQGITVRSGDGTAVMDIVARNTGGTAPREMVLTLTLPSGVRVVPAEGGDGSGEGAGSASISTCPPGSGTVTCRAAGPVPGGTRTFRVHLMVSGERQRDILGTLAVEGTDTVRFTVPVVVLNSKEAPA